MAASELPLSTLTLFVLFGTNWIVYSCLWMHERRKHKLSLKKGGGGGGGVRGSDVITIDDEGRESTGKGQVAHKAKKISQPLAMTLPSIMELSGSLAHMAVLITIAWLCEHRPPYPHQQKVHDMDMFWCLALCLAVVSFMDVRKSKGGDILNREQTEEWKGWMQFLFLMYHYFSAHEVYNSIRVMITSYVWMTGFGNFSFFYMKADFSLIRCLQMLWRLNFLVLLLCMVMDNTYILYYICPLHTFYFFVTYATMRVFPNVNHSRMGIRYKLMAVGLLIYCVWDLPLGLFRYLFFFLSDTPKLGAGSGTMWEWYFRSSLDHWSTFLGMIFALNFPMSMLWMKKVEEKLPYRQQLAVKGLVSIVCVGAVCWWALTILPEPKLEYNQSNAYYGCLIPMLSYIFLRNLTPTLRTTYLEPLHALGKITLETYLFQHHVWLTSNAKTVLTFIPSMPKVNLIVTGLMYVIMSKHANTLTLYMRGILMPDDIRHTLMNMFGATVAMMMSCGLAVLLQHLEADWAGVIISCTAAGLLVLSVLHTVLRKNSTGTGGASSNGSSNGSNGSTNDAEDQIELLQVPSPIRDRKGSENVEVGGGGGGGTNGGAGSGGGNGAATGASKGTVAAKKAPASPSRDGDDKPQYDGQLLRGWNLSPALGACLLGVFVSLGGHGVVKDYLVQPATVTNYNEDKEQGESCLRTVNQGMWKTAYSTCEGEPRAPWYNMHPYCNAQKWTWIDVPDQCHLSIMDVAEITKLYKDKTIVLMGDSIERHMYYAILRSMGQETPQALDTSQAKHADFSWQSEDGKTHVHFLWAALINDLNERAAQVFSRQYGAADVLVLGGGLWDALHTRDVAAYSQGLEDLVSAISAAPHGALHQMKVTWVKITAVVQSRLKDEDKKTYMTDEKLRLYKDAVAKSGLLESVDAFIDGFAVTSQRADQCDDGVHYSFEVYDTFAQLLANTVKIFSTDRHEGGEAADGGSLGSNAKATGEGGVPAPAPKKAPQQHDLGSMANPLMGAMVLGVGAIMIFSMDAYHGLARLSLSLVTGITLTWEDAYNPLLAKLGRIRPPPHPFPRVHA